MLVYLANKYGITYLPQLPRVVVASALILGILTTNGS